MVVIHPIGHDYLIGVVHHPSFALLLCLVTMAVMAQALEQVAVEGMAPYLPPWEHMVNLCCWGDDASGKAGGTEGVSRQLDNPVSFPLGSQVEGVGFVPFLTAVGELGVPSPMLQTIA
jgi:hypothetical protein